MNMKTRSPENKISRLLDVIGKPARLRILMAIGTGEACVCHLETLLSMRQAYISQHLMALRSARILATRRSGRFIYYRLRDPNLLEIIRLAGELSGLPQDRLEAIFHNKPLVHCECPKCAANKPAVDLQVQQP